MRALRVVGITEGGDVVLEDPGRRERFSVPADEQLRAAARGDLTRLGQIAIELESQLRPREIQARIRAGASVEQVASAAGVPIQKIERFAYPVLLERLRTAEVAQRAHPLRAEGPDVRMLGDVVAHTFGLRGQEYSEAEWDSWKGEDGKWVVALSWRAGRSDNRAHWTFQPGAHGGTVTAVDEHANDLVEGLPARPLRTVGPVIDIARTEEPPPAPEPVEQLRAAASDTARRAPAPEPTRGAPERPSVRTPAEVRRTAPPAPRPPSVEQRPEYRPAERERVEQQAAPVAERPAAPPVEQPPPAPQAAATPAPAPPVAPPPLVAPPEPPVDAPEPQAPAAAAPGSAPTAEPGSAPAEEQPAADRPEATPASKRTKKGKPVMPSWDEVLLGVRGQR